MWHGDTSFSLEERAAIEEGDAWTAAHTGRDPHAIVWDLEPGGPSTEHTIRNGPVPAPFDATENDHHIRINASMFGEWEHRLSSIASTAAHEFGHDAGMQHHDGPGTMNPSAPPVLMWTNEDRAECHRAGACR